MNKKNVILCFDTAIINYCLVISCEVIDCKLKKKMTAKTKDFENGTHEGNG